jgi:hypothetical protein
MKRALLTAVAALAAIYAVGVTWRQNERAAGLDFYIYFVAGQLAGRADVENIYSPEVQERIGEEYFERAQRSGSELRKYDAQRRRRLDNVSSPFLYSTLRWVSRDYERALRQYHALVLFAFVAGFLLIARVVRISWASALFVLAGVLLYYRGFEADLRVGNVNSLQLLAIGIALSTPPFLAGVILGMLICFKPNLILIPLLIAFTRIASRQGKRLRMEIAGGATGSAIAIIIAAISYGSPGVWVQWITAANQFWHRLPTRMERNVTPALALFHEHGEWVSYAIAIALMSIAGAAIRRGRRGEGKDVLVAGVAILIYLMSATVVWLHYMVLVIPVVLALMRWRSTAIVSLLALAAIAEEPFEMLAGKAAAPIESMLITPALAALFLCAVWKLSDPDPSSV